MHLSRNAVLVICKSFVRSHLDYDHILYNKPDNENSLKTLGEVQYMVCLAITCAIQEFRKRDLWWVVLTFTNSQISRHWVCKLTFFYKIAIYFFNIANGLLLSYQDLHSQKNYRLRSAAASQIKTILPRKRPEKLWKKHFRSLNKWMNNFKANKKMLNQVMFLKNRL